MAEPKKPADHKPKAEKPKVDKSGENWTVTHRGVTVSVSPDAFDDFELLDDLAELENGQGQRLPRVLRRLVGESGYKDVMDGLRDKKTGRVPVEQASEFVGEVLNALNPNS